LLLLIKFTDKLLYLIFVIIIMKNKEKNIYYLMKYLRQPYVKIVYKLIENRRLNFGMLTEILIKNYPFQGVLYR